jgi:hypothetical protein
LRDKRGEFGTVAGEVELRFGEALVFVIAMFVAVDDWLVSHPL